MRKEFAFYARQRLAYGTPLDNRGKAAKPECTISVATIVDSRQMFENFVALEQALRLSWSFMCSPGCSSQNCARALSGVTYESGEKMTGYD